MTKIEMQYMESVKKIARVMSQPGETDWEERRYEIAKAALNALLQNMDPCLVGGPSIEACAESAVKAADMLVEKLKAAENKDADGR